MDIFVEQLIKKRMGPKDYMIIGATILVGLVLILASLLFLPAFFIMILLGVGFGAYYIITSRSVEFEYSVTNGDLTIDKIICQRKRKRVISIDAHTIEDMGKFRPELLKTKSSYKPYITSENDDARGSWYFCAHSAKEGNVLVTFDPNDKVMNALKPFVPRQVAFVAFDRH